MELDYLRNRVFQYYNNIRYLLNRGIVENDPRFIEFAELLSINKPEDLWYYYDLRPIFDILEYIWFRHQMKLYMNVIKHLPITYQLLHINLYNMQMLHRISN